jgi:hypothetical protein
MKKNGKKTDNIYNTDKKSVNKKLKLVGLHNIDFGDVFSDKTM